MRAAHQANSAPRTPGQARKVVDEPIVGGIVHRRGRDADQQSAVAFAGYPCYSRAGNDADVEIDACRCPPNQEPERTRLGSFMSAVSV